MKEYFPKLLACIFAKPLTTLIFVTIARTDALERTRALQTSLRRRHQMESLKHAAGNEEKHCSHMLGAFACGRCALPAIARARGQSKIYSLSAARGFRRHPGERSGSAGASQTGVTIVSLNTAWCRQCVEMAKTRPSTVIRVRWQSIS